MLTSTSSIVITHGTKVSILQMILEGERGVHCPSQIAQYNANSSRMFKISLSFPSELHSEGLFVSALDNSVYVSTASESLQVFNLSNAFFEEVFNDSEARSAQHHVNLSHTITLLADKEGRISGHWHGESNAYYLQAPAQPLIFSDSPKKGVMVRLFEARMPRMVVRLYKFAHGTPWQPQIAPTTTHVLATCLDGTVYNCQILPENEMRLLYFIQRLAMSSRRVSPFDPITLDTVDVDIVTGFHGHVDCDILQRLVEVGEQELGDLLMLRPLAVEASIEDRLKQFKDLCNLVLEEVLEENLVVRAFEFVKERLDVAL